MRIEDVIPLSSRRCQSGRWLQPPSIGIQQTWKNVPKVAGAVYVNDSNRAIAIHPTATVDGGGSTGSYVLMTVNINGEYVASWQSGAPGFAQAVGGSVVVPPGAFYQVIVIGGWLSTFMELS